MQVVEIFDSIQGEGYWMGTYCTFVRLAGCNLKCSFCDEAKKYGKAKEMTIEQIVKECKQPIVIITGGEPTIQAQLPELIDALHKANHSVHIETNGSGNCRFLGGMMPDWVTVSPKKDNDFAICTNPTELKFVVDEALEWTTIEQIYEDWPTTPIWLQPCDGPWLEESKKKIIKWVGQSNIPCVRAGIQLHKWYEVV